MSERVQPNRITDYVKGMFSDPYKDSISLQKRQEFEQMRGSLKFIRDEYRLRVRFRMHGIPNFVRYDHLTVNSASETLKHLRPEIEKYPPDFFNSIGVNSIQVGADVRTIDSHGSQSVYGFALGNTAYIDGDRYPQILVNTFHHEVFHLIDNWRMNPTNAQTKDVLDLGWMQEFKARGFIHGILKNRDVNDEFVDDYGMTNGDEDRATIGSVMMVNPLYLKEIARKNPILNTKTNRVYNIYKRTSSGKMDNSYFRALAKGEVNFGYWQNAKESTID